MYMTVTKLFTKFVKIGKPYLKMEGFPISIWILKLKEGLL